ncbi:SpoVG family protein [Ruminococcus sp. zg-924]|uniref:SpoVG family protein n=1 Tax=Ruminococcus sp. zg-924 TaxID=2678505 RepID=UPI002109D39C|nr:SpoVG family protein [Ruminococcus sp. zg-924]MCQ4022862.1 hypothetical protein [Ruminococcus sp. zg-924]
MAKSNNFKRISNGNHKLSLPRINTKIDNLVDNDTNLRAFASITVGGAVAIHGIRVMDSKKGLFVSMPSYSYEDRNGETQYADYAHPISKEARNAINKKVLDAYEQALDESESEDEDEDYGEDYDESDNEESEEYDDEPDEAPSFRQRM